MKNRLVKMIPVILFPLLTWLISAPAGLETETWHMFGLCLSLLCGLILKPFSEPVISLIVWDSVPALLKTSCFVQRICCQGVWFLLAVLLACGAFKKTGLGKRLAYILLSKFGGTKFGRSSLGLGYVMMLCDLILSPATGSNTSRSAIVFPIFRGVSESLGSYPDKDPPKAGRISGAAGTCSCHVHSSIVSDRNGIQCSDCLNH